MKPDRSASFKPSANGRTGSTPKRVPDVETMPCGDGMHRLVNNAAGVTRCTGCGATWGELDAVARAGVRR